MLSLVERTFIQENLSKDMTVLFRDSSLNCAALGKSSESFSELVICPTHSLRSLVKSSSWVSLVANIAIGISFFPKKEHKVSNSIASMLYSSIYSVLKQIEGTNY